VYDLFFGFDVHMYDLVFFLRWMYDLVNMLCVAGRR
jgi:hypothetical protein